MGAKAAIEGMTRGMARDLGGDNIRVNAIILGGVRTPRQEALWHTPEEEARILAGQCLPQRVEIADVAALALFLAGQCGALLRPRVLCGRGMVRRLMYHTQRSTHNWRRKHEENPQHGGHRRHDGVRRRQRDGGREESQDRFFHRRPAPRALGA
jgi:hypothetical protein